MGKGHRVVRAQNVSEITFAHVLKDHLSGEVLCTNAVYGKNVWMLKVKHYLGLLQRLGHVFSACARFQCFYSYNVLIAIISDVRLCVI